MLSPGLKNHIKKILGPGAIQFLKHNLAFLHSQISYSQSGEDLLLDSFLSHKRKGFYVDVGAYDPVYLSNTYKFYKRGWRGIQIEPNPKRIAWFKKRRPGTINLNVGIGEKSTSKFFIFDADALSTFSAEEAAKAKSFGHEVLDTITVDILPLKEVFDAYAKDTVIDFMSVDTEGYDLEVLKTNDWTQYRPQFIVLETVEYDRNKYGKKENAVYDKFMSEINYEKVADTYINTIYRDTKADIPGW
ncbi:MAG: FkbM family methyltransferase [bacterium]